MNYWQIYPPVKCQFEIPTDRFHCSRDHNYLAQADQVADPPVKWQFEIPTDRFLLWQLRQIKWQIYPPVKWQFEIPTDRFLLWELRQIKWQIRWHIYPTLRWHLMDKSGTNLGLVDSELIFGRSTVDRIYTPIKWQFEIPTDRFLL